METVLTFRKGSSTKTVKVDIPELEEGWELWYQKVPEASKLPVKFTLPGYPGKSKLIRTADRIWVAYRPQKKDQEICPDCVLIDNKKLDEYWASNPSQLAPNIRGFTKDTSGYDRWSEEIDELYKAQQKLAAEN